MVSANEIPVYFDKSTHESNRLEREYLYSDINNPNLLGKETGTKYCEIDSNQRLMHFSIFILIPNIILRAYSFWKYKGRDPLDFREGCGEIILVVYNGTFGCWAIYHIYNFLNISKTCKIVRSLSLLNY